MSDIKLSKKDVKTPDLIQQELQKGFQWSAQHSKAVGLALLAFLIVGLGISGKSWFDEKTETEIQAQYFKIEKTFLEKKANFAAAEEQSKAPKAANKTKETPPEPILEKASGDLEKDYGNLTADFMKIIEKKPKSKAAKMAALNLADLQLEYKKREDAQKTLSLVSTDSKDLLSGLVLVQMGTLQADLQDCNQAVSTWGKVLQNSGAKALHSATKLKQALCFETLNDLPRAEKLYAEVKAEDKDSASAKSADKYLRLLQAKKQ